MDGADSADEFLDAFHAFEEARFEFDIRGMRLSEHDRSPYSRFSFSEREREELRGRREVSKERYEEAKSRFKAALRDFLNEV